MTTSEWETAFELLRAFVVAGISIGLVAALIAATTRD